MIDYLQNNLFCEKLKFRILKKQYDSDNTKERLYPKCLEKHRHILLKGKE